MATGIRFAGPNRPLSLEEIRELVDLHEMKEEVEENLEDWDDLEILDLLNERIKALEKRLPGAQSVQSEKQNLPPVQIPVEQKVPSIGEGLDETRKGLGILWTAVKLAAGRVADSIKSVTDLIKDQVVGAVKSAGRKLDSINDQIWDTAQAGVTQVRRDLTQAALESALMADKAASGVVNKTASLWNAVKEAAVSVKNHISAAFKVLVKNPVEKTAEAVHHKLSEKVDAFQQKITTKAQEIKSRLEHIKDEIRTEANKRNTEGLYDEADTAPKNRGPGN